MFTDLRHSRRSAVATLLGAALLRQAPSAAQAKSKRKATASAADACFPGGTTCRPGRGKNTSRCDFAFSTVFHNTDVRGSNLSHSNFVDADLRGTDLRGANLSGGCFIGADLLGAKVGASVNLDKAIFCNTRMPDGTIDNSGCAGTTACCHRRLQDCPDGTVACRLDAGPGQCGACVSVFPTAGRCWHGDKGTCCPCDHADQAYWTNLCNTTVEACKPNKCVGDDNTLYFGGCFGNCSGEDLC